MVTTTRGLRSVKRALGVSWSALHAESGPAGPIGALGLMNGLSESELGAKKGDLERSHESELERSGAIWSANRARGALRASLRGQWGQWGHLG